MASLVKKSRSKKDRRRGNGGYDRLRRDPLGGLPGEAECAKGKLSRMDEYRLCRPSELNKLALDLTDRDRLKATWFDTPQGHAQADGGGAQQATARHHSRVSLKLYLPQPHWEDREHTFTGSVVRRDSIESQFEQFCSYGINSEAALQVGDQYLKWMPNSLVIPKGVMKIRDDTAGEGAQPHSISDDTPIDLGDSDRLDQLLELVATYNGTRVYNSTGANSKHFVYEALRKLGKNIPSHLRAFDNYRQRITEARDLVIPQTFASHLELDNYFKQNHADVVKKERNVEFLFFLCVCFHVKKGPVRDSSACAEKDCCLPFLLSDLTQENLMFNGFWRDFILGQ